MAYAQILRRLVALALVVFGMIRLGASPVWPGILVLLAGIGVYLLWPRVQRPEGALLMQALPAIVLPDLMGLALSGFFAALPFWVGQGVGSGGMQGAALLLWPMAIGAASLLVVGLRNACFALELTATGVVLTRLGGRRVLAYDEIRRTHPWRRGLPRVLRLLVPVLPPGPAGALLLARDSTGIELELTNGERLRLPHEGFEPGEAALRRALGQHVKHAKTRRQGR